MSTTSNKTSIPKDRLLEPRILASLSTLELVAKTVVEGFIMGLHRSLKFGFSQEFIEYRSYAEGDDPRHIDWNVFARSGRTYIKRFLGETNSHLMILLDVSASMGFKSHNTTSTKLEYGKYLSASLAYISSRQHDAIGVITFNNEVVEFLPPTSKNGSLQRVIHLLDNANATAGTIFNKPFTRLHQFIKKRGLIAIVSDFYCEPKELLDKVSPLTLHGQDIIIFHLLDPSELHPDIQKPSLLEDMETGHRIEVSANYMAHDYPYKIQAHIHAIEEACNSVNVDYVLLNTSEPLDNALHRYLSFREKKG